MSTNGMGDVELESRVSENENNLDDSLEGAFSRHGLLNTEVNNMQRIMEMMIEENRRRDAMMERMFLQYSNGVPGVPQDRNQSSSNSNELSSFHIMPDLSKSIKQYDGEGGGIKAKEWIRNLCSMQQLHHWPDSFTLETAKSNLRGGAADWYSYKQIEIQSWLEFREAFNKTYVGGVNLTMKWQKMVERVQKKEESLNGYYFEKVKLCREVGLDFDEIKEQVLIGLWSKELCASLLAMQHHDEDGLFHSLTSMARVQQTRLNRMTKVRTGYAEKTADQKIVPKEKAVPRVAEKNSSDFKCFNCNKLGHRSFECTLPRREKGSCYHCGSMSHIVSDCPGRTRIKNAGIGATNLIQTPMLQVDSSTLLVSPYTVSFDYYVKDEGNCTCKYSLVALVDSGSPISLVKSKYVPIDLIKTGHMDHTFTGINDSKVNVLGTFSQSIKLKEIDVFIKFYVVPDDTMSHPCILGRDFISLPTIKVNFGKELQIEKIDANSDNTVSEIMNINVDCKNVSCDLRINPDLEFNISNEVKQIYNDHYVMVDRPVQPNVKHEMNICLTHQQPFSVRTRRLSFTEKDSLKKLLDELLEKGIICPSNSPYCSAIVLIKKKNSTDYRLCIDYRQLNKITIRDHYPIPLIDDQLDLLKDKKYFTSLDLKNGFHHVSMAKDSQKYTSFITSLGQFEYLKVPFGLSNSPAVFQRFINDIFKDLIRDGRILLYLDDILIATKDIAEHLDLLRQVFDLMVQNLLELRIDKCSFIQREIIYLGYLINDKGIKPNPENIVAVTNYPVPKNSKEVHRFVGLSSYFRRFIPQFSIIAKPLYDLIKKNCKFKFESEELHAFETLKNKLTESPILAIYSPNLITEIHCDACSTGYGAVLLQKQANNLFQPVFYYSKRTTDTESRYHSYELELLAIINALNRFHVYVQGIKFSIVTDCNSIKLALAKKEINPRINRWALTLQNYDYNLEHRPNGRMRHVDALSRSNNILVLEENTFEQNLAISQNLDKIINDIKSNLEIKEDRNFELRNGLVYKKFKNTLLFYVPQAMERNVISNSHDNLGHIGLDKSVEYLTRTYWFPELREKVRNYIQNCIKCITYSSNMGKPEGILHNIPKGDKPFITIHIDHYGPLEKTPTGKKYIFEIIDAFTKFVKLYDVKTTKTIEAIHKLENYFVNYSCPTRIVSDRGSAFTSQEFNDFINKYKIIHIKIATASPKSNGQIERTNRDLTPMLSKLAEHKNKWNNYLSQVEFAINNSFCRSINNSPAMLLFGINQKDMNDDLRDYIESQSDYGRDLAKIRLDAEQQNSKVQSYNKLQFDKKHKPPHEYQLGDYVMVKNFDVTVGVNKKLIPKYRGPYEVIKILDNDRYVLSDIENFQVTQIPYKGICCPENMKLWMNVQ